MLLGSWPQFGMNQLKSSKEAHQNIYTQPSVHDTSSCYVQELSNRQHQANDQKAGTPDHGPTAGTPDHGPTAGHTRPKAKGRNTRPGTGEPGQGPKAEQGPRQQRWNQNNQHRKACTGTSSPPCSGNSSSCTGTSCLRDNFCLQNELHKDRSSLFLAKRPRSDTLAGFLKAFIPDALCSTNTVGLCSRLTSLFSSPQTIDIA